MTQDEPNLLHNYLEEKVADADRPRLQSLLRENASAHAMLRSLGTVDARLLECAATNRATLQWMASAPDPVPQFSENAATRTWFRGVARMETAGTSLHGVVGAPQRTRSRLGNSLTTEIR